MDRAVRLRRIHGYGRERAAVLWKPTPEMLRAAAAAHLDNQRCNLWGRSFAVLDEDREIAIDFVVEVVEGVLAELAST